MTAESLRIIQKKIRKSEKISFCNLRILYFSFFLFNPAPNKRRRSRRSSSCPVSQQHATNITASRTREKIKIKGYEAIYYVPLPDTIGQQRAAVAV
jgi:hypothetical protein